MGLETLDNPVKNVRNAILYNIESDTYLSTLLNNTSLSEPITYKTSIENLKHFNCPAVGCFYPLELPFTQSIYAEDLKQLPATFFIDVVVEDSDYVTSQDNCLSLALYIARVLSQDSVKPLPDSNGLYTCQTSDVVKIVEIGSNPYKTGIFQFAYRIYLDVEYYWSDLNMTV